VDTIAEGPKGRDKRTKRTLTRIVNHHNPTSSPLRNPSQVLVKRDKNINGAKGDQRFRYVKWAAIEDQDLRNAMASPSDDPQL